MSRSIKIINYFLWDGLAALAFGLCALKNLYRPRGLAPKIMKFQACCDTNRPIDPGQTHSPRGISICGCLSVACCRKSYIAQHTYVSVQLTALQYFFFPYFTCGAQWGFV